jgi:hypothetical protein
MNGGKKDQAALSMTNHFESMPSLEKSEAENHEPKSNKSIHSQTHQDHRNNRCDDENIQLQPGQLARTQEPVHVCLGV